MDKSLEDLEKKFILDADMEHKDINSLISRILNLCQVDKNGFVKIEDKFLKKLNLIDKIILILSARHLANKLQTKLGKEVTIREEMTSQEIANMLREKKIVINARLKELKDKKQAIPVERGTYKVAPYAVSDILDKMEAQKNE